MTRSDKTTAKTAGLKKSKTSGAGNKKRVVNPVQSLLDFVVQKLDAGKADKITVLDLKGKSTLADYMVIASGTSSRHVLALVHNLAEDLKKKGIRSVSDGAAGDGAWVVLDLGDVIVHVFNPESRAYYALEEIWTA